MATGKNKQLAINMMAQFLSFGVSMGISFVLTPFIVRTLGAAAYGFVGLTTNIVGYTSLLTIALNSMASRYITISYTQGKFDDANRYFSSVFYSNMGISAFIILVMGITVCYLEYVFEIPDELVFDVKLLFSLLVLNTIVSLMTNIYGVATFIKNRLELSTICSIVGNAVRAVALIVMFGFLTPHLWYFGITAMLVSVYLAYANFHFTRRLTPELRVRRVYFDLGKVKELTLSGMWNLFNKLGGIFAQGMDLVLVNLFIGATAMGYFSIANNIPMLFISICASIAGVFAPLMTTYYAQKNMQALISELNKSIRILGCLCLMPLVTLYIYGADFYSLWIPTEDPVKLQVLTLLVGFGMVFSMPLEALWNIFTITNKLKYSTIYIFCQQILSFFVVLSMMFVVDDIYIKLCIIAGTRTAIGIIKSVLFLPIYGSICLNVSKKTFYVPLYKSFLCFTISMCICYVLRQFYAADTWMKFVFASLICCVVVGLTGLTVILKKEDRLFIRTKILRIK